MKNHSIRVISGSGRTKLELEARRIGKDWSIQIQGGEAHIGACSVGAVDPRSGRAFASVISLPGHKEAPWALEAAEQIAKQVRGKVFLVLGIHLKTIQKKEIEQLKINFQEILLKFHRKVVLSKEKSKCQQKEMLW